MCSPCIGTKKIRAITTIALIFFILIPWLKEAGFCEIFISGSNADSEVNRTDCQQLPSQVEAVATS